MQKDEFEMTEELSRKRPDFFGNKAKVSGQTGKP